VAMSCVSAGAGPTIPRSDRSRPSSSMPRTRCPEPHGDDRHLLTTWAEGDRHRPPWPTLGEDEFRDKTKQVIQEVAAGPGRHHHRPGRSVRPRGAPGHSPVRVRSRLFCGNGRRRHRF
jgi:hypothetical protein